MSVGGGGEVLSPAPKARVFIRVWWYPCPNSLPSLPPNPRRAPFPEKLDLQLKTLECYFQHSLWISQDENHQEQAKSENNVRVNRKKGNSSSPPTGVQPLAFFLLIN